MRATSEDEIFLPAIRDEAGNIEIELLSKIRKITGTATVVLLVGFVLRLIISDENFFEFIEDNPRLGLIFVGLFGSAAWAIAHMWTSKVIISEQHIKVYELWNIRSILYEDIEKVGCVWSYKGSFVIKCRRGRGINFPFGGVGTAELVELFIRKCSLRRCAEVYEEIEMIQKKRQKKQDKIARG